LWKRLHRCREISSRNREALAGYQLDRALVHQIAGPDLRSLKVGQNADRFGQPSGHLPQALDRPGVILMSSVRKIEARHIHSGAH